LCRRGHAAASSQQHHLYGPATDQHRSAAESAARSPGEVNSRGGDLNPEDEKLPPPRRPVRTLPQWESAVDRQIREAQERGAFDNLAGRGKPLDLSSWGHGDWALAHHVLQQAGETLPWIALGRDIEARQAHLAALLDEAPTLGNFERPRARARYLREAAELDKLLEEYAFMIPSRRLERGRLPPHIATAQFDAACLKR
jgi:hypothetical protein